MKNLDSITPEHYSTEFDIINFMGTGNLNPIPPENLEQKKEIPISWFIGTGTRDQGIIVVGFSEEFKNLDTHNPLGLKHHLGEYLHYMGNRLVDGRPVINSDEIQDTEEKNIVQTAETYIKKVTGFSAEELNRKRAELSSQYRGKQEAPFLVEFY